jgi:signal transduction histidine kinase
VVSRREGKRTILHIEDHGEGIPPDRVRQIFKPFFTTRHQGTGLGLAVARKVVEAHGGTIRVSSAPGVMTRFSILLPTE